MRKILACITAISLTVFAGCALPGEPAPSTNITSTTPAETVSDVLLMDAGIYAKQEGVSLEEAVKRFKLMDLAGPLGAALEQNESATLVGYWMEHKPEFKLVAVFTRDGEQTIRKYVNEDSPLWPVLEVRNGDMPTEAQLREIQQEVGALLDKLALPCATDTDIKKGCVNIYVGDKKLFDETLANAGATLSPHVEIVVFYEPIYGDPPFPINPDPSIHFPQMKMLGWGDMEVLMVGKMTVKDGYIYIGDNVVIWKPDYFVNSDNGTIEILDREGKVVAREGEEVVMGGGGVSLEQINKYLKEPLPADFKGNLHLQGSGTRLSLNFNSELFHMDAIANGDHEIYFLTAKQSLNEAITEKITVTGSFTAGTGSFFFRSPVIISDPKPEENKTSVQYTTFWPEGYTGGVTDGVFEVLDNEGNIVVQSGDRITVEGRVLYNFNSTAEQLFNELPGGLTGPHLIVERIIK